MQLPNNLEQMKAKGIRTHQTSQIPNHTPTIKYAYITCTKDWLVIKLLGKLRGYCTMRFTKSLTNESQIPWRALHQCGPLKLSRNSFHLHFETIMFGHICFNLHQICPLSLRCTTSNVLQDDVFWNSYRLCYFMLLSCFMLKL